MARKDMTALVQLPADAHTLFNPTYTALSGFTGMQWQNTGREMVWIINGASACNYTINIGAKVVGQTVTPFGPTALPTNNTAGRSLGPFSVAYNQADGNVYIDFDTPTTVTVAVVQMPGV